MPSWLQCLYRCENQCTGCSSLFTHSKYWKRLLYFVLFFWLFVTFLFRNSSFLLMSPSLFRDLFLRVWHWFDYTTSSEKPETQSYEDNSALQISFVIFRLDNWRERSLSFSRRRSEYRSIVIQYERRPKFLFGNSSATPPTVSRGSLHPRLCFFFHFLRFWPRSQTQNLLLPFCRHRSISFGSRGIIISQMSKKTFVQHKCHLLLTRNEIFWDLRNIAY